MPTIEEILIARLEGVVDGMGDPSDYTSYELLRAVGPFPPRHVSAVALARACEAIEYAGGGGTGGGGHAYVKAFDPPWQASNPTAVMTADGVAFGPYADGKAAGGSLRYLGLNGQPFSVVKNLVYNARYLDDEMHLLNPGASPYCRVFTQDAQGNAHDAAFTPGSQLYPGIGPGPMQEFVATSGMWRYDADDGTGGVPIDQLIAQFGDHLITKITITFGFTDGTNLVGLLRWWQINGVTYNFGTEG